MTPLTSLAGSIGAVGLIAALTPSAPDVGAGVGEDPCKVVDVEYALAATLQLVDTPLGKGDGNYTIGPGTVVLRFDRRAESRPPRAKMIEYRMQEHFTIQTTALFWSATVVTATSTHATPDSCEDVADGVLADRKLLWSSPVRGYATDGELTCEGSLCGKFGAPPAGRSPFHVAPHPVQFSSFEFAADNKTFTMRSTLVSKTESPKQTAYVALAGREVRRSCVSAFPCQ